jgi:hypothetical protein
MDVPNYLITLVVIMFLVSLNVVKYLTILTVTFDMTLTICYKIYYTGVE